MKLPDAALQQHIAILGKTGAGKSAVMRSIVERLLDEQKPVCIIDPKGDWYGLKSSADGKQPGYPVVIFGGEHADVPINTHAGAHIAELVATGNRPCIIDLGGWMVGERTRFFIDFASILFRHAKGLRWLVIDECHNFAPQGKVIDPDAGKMLHWANRLASEGRGKGLQIIAASQRPQKVAKDFLTSCETLIAMRVIHPLDRNAIKDWIDGCPDAEKGKEVLQSLASMPRGTGWVWSPEIDFGPTRIAFQMFNTYDSFKAPTGEETKLKGWAAVDLDDVKAKLATVVKEAESNDPKLLRKRIAELERDVAKAKGANTIAAMELEKEELRLEYERGRREGFQQCAANLAPMLDRITTLRVALTEDLSGLVDDLRRVAAKAPQQPAAAPAQRAPAAPAALTHTEPPRAPPARSTTVPRTNGVKAPDSPLGNTGKRRMLIALAQNPNGLTGRKLSILTGISQSGGTWRTYLTELRTNGWVEGNREELRITAAGRTVLGAYDPLPTGEALREYWRARLGNTGKTKILDTLIAYYPDSVSAEAVAAETGIAITGGTWRTYLTELRGLELVEGPKNALRASEVLFE